jgi:hypothetical protein
MALKQNIVILGDIELTEAYLRVENVCIPNKQQMSFALVARKTRESEVVNSVAHRCLYDIQGNNPIAQAYEYCKTLPAYSSAVDC